MPHNIFGTKLNRDTNQRQALLKGLVGALIRSEAIETTEAKAKAVRGLVDQLVTHARKNTLTSIRQIESVILDKDLIYKLVHSIAPRFQSRPGGYTRLIKMGHRTGDNAPMVRMEFTASAVAVPPPSVKTKKVPASFKKKTVAKKK